MHESMNSEIDVKITANAKAPSLERNEGSIFPFIVTFDEYNNGIDIRVGINAIIFNSKNVRTFTYIFFVDSSKIATALVKCDVRMILFLFRLAK
ncbi:MAG: hypothetical protein PHH30_08700 [Bacteroidales bacterium]|nr:hypothetical protein [Bacteroidales bacterium]MDD3860795.1 hypothetical protein [Bacteroidales bacterium]